MDATKKILIVGKTGSGKSVEALSRVKEHDRYIIYDTQGEYLDGVYFDELDKLYEFLVDRGDKPFRVVFFPVNPDRDISEVCRFAYALGDLCLMTEEIDLYSSPAGIDPEFNNIIRRGRHKNISVIATSQRPVGINKIITSQFNEMIIFRQDEPRDIDYLQDRIGAEAKKLSELKPYHYLHYINGDCKIIDGFKKDLAIPNPAS